MTLSQKPKNTSFIRLTLGTGYLLHYEYYWRLSVASTLPVLTTTTCTVIEAIPTQYPALNRFGINGQNY